MRRFRQLLEAREESLERGDGTGREWALEQRRDDVEDRAVAAKVEPAPDFVRSENDLEHRGDHGGGAKVRRPEEGSHLADDAERQRIQQATAVRPGDAWPKRTELLLRGQKHARNRTSPALNSARQQQAQIPHCS